MLMFCSPHNPIGRVWKKAELEKAIPEMDGTDDTILEADMIRDALLPKMSELRIPCDEAESLTEKKYWPFPTYADLMFAGK